MKIEITGEAKEIAALVLAVQGQQISLDVHSMTETILGRLQDQGRPLFEGNATLHR